MVQDTDNGARAREAMSLADAAHQRKALADLRQQYEHALRILSHCNPALYQHAPELSGPANTAARALTTVLAVIDEITHPGEGTEWHSDTGSQSPTIGTKIRSLT